jgi:hypothetical protein
VHISQEYVSGSESDTAAIQIFIMVMFIFIAAFGRYILLYTKLCVPYTGASLLCSTDYRRLHSMFFKNHILHLDSSISCYSHKLIMQNDLMTVSRLIGIQLCNDKRKQTLCVKLLIVFMNIITRVMIQAQIHST